MTSMFSKTLESRTIQSNQASFDRSSLAWLQFLYNSGTNFDTLGQAIELFKRIFSGNLLSNSG